VAISSFAQTSITLGSGTSSSSTRGPLQRSDTASSSVFSRWIQVFTEAELTAAGMTDGVAISQLNWELASSNTIIGTGDAPLKIYVKNSTATAAVSDTWDNYTAGSTLVYDENFNTTNNFPGANGWMPFTFDSPFIYNGGALEVAVDWDCSQISTPAFSGDGSLKWRWSTTAPDFLVAKKTASSSPPSTVSDVRDERANIQIVYSEDAGNISGAGTIGAGTSSSSSRGPFQRSDTTSSSVFSRFVHVYTQAELDAAGISSGMSITKVSWDLNSTNTIIGSGDANLKIYIRNSSATEAVSDTWVNHIAGSDLVYDMNFNTTNNFPGETGWMEFDFNTPVAYSGNSLEIAVDWDCSQVTTPAFSGDGSLKWKWSDTAPEFLVVKKTSSSSASSNITDLLDDRANIQISYTTAVVCPLPEGLEASNVMPTSADLAWSASMGAVAYNWVIVESGGDPEGTTADSGSTAAVMASSAALSELTGYDLYVQTDCGDGNTSGFAGPYSFSTPGADETSAQIGAGTSSSSSRGPIQRSDTTSSTVFSRWVHTYTAAELAAAGLTSDDVISSLSWELASSNVIIGDGNATFKVYIKNSTATEAVAGDWNTMITGSALVVDNAYNMANNFPGENGWMPFDFSTPFTYTGDAIEIAVDWDCSQVTTPAFSGDGSLKWRWESTAPDFLVAKKTSSSSASSNISDLRDERANIQFAFTPVSNDIPGCTDSTAENYDPLATVDDGSCTYPSESCKGDFNEDGIITASDLTQFLAVFGQGCSD